MASIKLSFKGETYTIPEDQAFEAAEVVEEVMTIPQIVAMQENPRFTKIARCFGAMLRFAGVKVSDREVHQEMMREIASLDSDADQEQGKEMLAAQAVASLLAVLMDGAPEGDGTEGGDAGKTKAS